MRMQHRSTSRIGSLVVVFVVLFTHSGCGGRSERDEHAAASKPQFGSSEWQEAAAEDISVRIVAVLRRPAETLSWIDEREMLQLTREEKKTVETEGVTGQMEVVYTTGRGSGSHEVRLVIIQCGPLSSNAVLAVPRSGSFIYVQDGGALKPLVTNSVVSSLKLEIYQEKRETAFFMDYPRDRTRYGGAVFWWDENGKWHML